MVVLGSKYLKETLQQKIQSIYESNEMYEIDPQKYHMLTPKLHEQQRKFEDLCGDIWRQIRESIDKFPWLVEEKSFTKIDALF